MRRFIQSALGVYSTKSGAASGSSTYISTVTAPSRLSPRTSQACLTSFLPVSQGFAWERFPSRGFCQIPHSASAGGQCRPCDSLCAKHQVGDLATPDLMIPEISQSCLDLMHLRGLGTNSVGTADKQDSKVAPVVNASFKPVRGQHYCKHPRCKTRASFEMEGSSKASYCVAHMLPDMVDVISPRCEQSDCRRKRLYNFDGARPGRFCVEHKLSGMVNVVHRRCEFLGCFKVPHFNMPEYSKGCFCAAHRQVGMVDVLSKVCEYNGCRTNPSYGQHGSQKAELCSKHRITGMVNVKGQVCEHGGCVTRPSFGFLSKKRSRFCSIHKLQGMVHHSLKDSVE